MKTNTKKLTVAVAISISLFTLSLNAQNTKSVQYAYYSNKTAESVSDRMNIVVHELAAQLNNLKALVKFNPSVIEEDSYSKEAVLDLSDIINEMEPELRFKPSENASPDIETAEVSNEMSDILQDLRSSVEFNPSQDFTIDSANSDMAVILNELSENIKYYPVASF